MKKVLILSYYFPPCNLTPSERIYSWAKYFKEFGYYPIIVTRNWDLEIKGFADELKSSGEKEKWEKHDGYEVCYLPYKQSLKESFYTEQGGLQRVVYLLLTVLTNLIQLFTFKFSPLRIFYNKADAILTESKDIDYLIVSAYPYAFFEYAHDLHKKHGVKWVADYRDDWTSNEILNKTTFHRILNKLNARNERKWLSNASFYISVSDFYVEKIKRVIGGGIDGFTIPNGYMRENYLIENVATHDYLSITYVGSLYHNQPIEEFLQAFKVSIDNLQKPAMKILFLGLKSNMNAYNRVMQEMQGYEDYIVCTDRMPKQEVIQWQAASHFLLSVTYEDMKGIPGSKLYEYIALRKPVIVFPGDEDIIENTLSETGQGIVARSKKEMSELLCTIYKDYEVGNILDATIDNLAIDAHDRKTHVAKLAKLLDIFGNESMHI